MNIMEQLQQKAKTDPRKVVFPEVNEEKILQAARKVLDDGIGLPVLVGTSADITALADKISMPLDGITLADHTDVSQVDSLVEKYAKINQDLPEKVLKNMAKDPMNFAAMMVATGEVDGMVAGKTHTTGEVILASQMIIGMQEGIDTVSSVGLAQIKGYEGPDGNLLAMADCAVNPAPDASELADIAIASADTTRSLIGWEPRVALLSFSTKGSAGHERVDMVLEALDIVKERRPDILIDGEFQLDSAIIPEVAAKKIKGESPVAGKANVLIFPDLSAGNIAIKIFGFFANGGPGAGPLLQGFAKPVCDLSRGASVDEIAGAATVVVVLAQNQDG